MGSRDDNLFGSQKKFLLARIFITNPAHCNVLRFTTHSWNSVEEVLTLDEHADSRPDANVEFFPSWPITDDGRSARLRVRTPFPTCAVLHV
jgi:hypothetical protein